MVNYKIKILAFSSMVFGSIHLVAMTWKEQAVYQMAPSLGIIIANNLPSSVSSRVSNKKLSLIGYCAGSVLLYSLTEKNSGCSERILVTAFLGGIGFLSSTIGDCLKRRMFKDDDPLIYVESALLTLAASAATAKLHDYIN